MNKRQHKPDQEQIFISPFSLEACVSRLRTRRKKINITLHKLDTSTYEFTASRGIFGSATGELWRDGEFTRVTMKSKPDWAIFGFVLIFGLLLASYQVMNVILAIGMWSYRTSFLESLSNIGINTQESYLLWAILAIGQVALFYAFWRILKTLYTKHAQIPLLVGSLLCDVMSDLRKAGTVIGDDGELVTIEGLAPLALDEELQVRLEQA